MFVCVSGGYSDGRESRCKVGGVCFGRRRRRRRRRRCLENKMNGVGFRCLLKIEKRKKSRSINLGENMDEIKFWGKSLGESYLRGKV